MKKIHSLSFKLPVIISLMSILMLLFLLSSSLYFSNKGITESINTGFENTVGGYANLFDSILNAQVMLNKSYTSGANIKNFFSNATAYSNNVYLDITSFVENNNFIENISIMDTRGVIVFDKNSQLIGRNFMDLRPTMMNKLLAGEEVAFGDDIVKSAATGDLTISLGVRILDYNDQLVGYLVSIIKIMSIYDAYFSNVSLGRTGRIVATGHEAKEMLGRTPEQIRAVRPMKEGVIADFTATQLMIKNIITKICRRYNAGKPRVVVGVPSGITEVEERAVQEAVSQAGAREVFLIEEPMAAAIGAGLDVAEPTGNMVLDIGGGTTEVAVISLGGIVISDSIKIAGDVFDEDIINYVKDNLNLAIGSTTAEQVKLELGCAMPLVTKKSLEVRGRDLTSGLPENRIITSDDVLEAMLPSIEKVIDLVKATLEKTPPELASDIVERGITLTGGGALIKNIDMLISQKTEIPVYIAERPLDCVANGTGKTIEDMDKLRTALINARKNKQ